LPPKIRKAFGAGYFISCPDLAEEREVVNEVGKP
jgi:hypothetical protein